MLHWHLKCGYKFKLWVLILRCLSISLKYRHNSVLLKTFRCGCTLLQFQTLELKEVDVFRNWDFKRKRTLSNGSIALHNYTWKDLLQLQIMHRLIELKMKTPVCHTSCKLIGQTTPLTTLTLTLWAWPTTFELSTCGFDHDLRDLELWPWPLWPWPWPWTTFSDTRLKLELLYFWPWWPL